MAAETEATYVPEEQQQMNEEPEIETYTQTTTRNNVTFKEVEVDRTRTLTLKTNDRKNIQTDKLFAYLSNLDVLDKIECIQKLTLQNDQIHEITTKTTQDRTIIMNLLKNQPIRIEDITLTITDNRTLRDVIKIPLIKVLIFEAPFELEDQHILHKLMLYGELQEYMIYNHKYRGTNVFNGVRSLNFKKIHKPIPTTLFIRGNRIKLKHEGQDREPVCGICKQKGHYRDKCPGILNPPVDLDQPKEHQQSQTGWSDIVKQGIQKKKKELEEQRQRFYEQNKTSKEEQIVDKLIQETILATTEKTVTKTIEKPQWETRTQRRNRKRRAKQQMQQEPKKQNTKSTNQKEPFDTDSDDLDSTMSDISDFQGGQDGQVVSDQIQSDGFYQDAQDVEWAETPFEADEEEV